MRRTLLSVLVLLLLAAGAASAQIGHTRDDITGKTAEQIVAAATSAGDSARTLHIKADTNQLKFELWLVAGKGGRGTISENGVSFQMVRLGSTAYFNGSDKFWTKFGGKAAAQLFHDRWIRASATKGDLAALTPITNLRALIDSTLTSHGKLEKGDRTTIQGRSTIAIHDTTDGSTLYVAASGTPYPMAITKTGSQGGTIVFDRWNEPVALAAPRNAIDYSALTKKK